MNDRTVEVIQAAIKEHSLAILDLYQDLGAGSFEEGLLISTLFFINRIDDPTSTCLELIKPDYPTSELNEHQRENRERIEDFTRWYNKTSYKEARC